MAPRTTRRSAAAAKSSKADKSSDNSNGQTKFTPLTSTCNPKVFILPHSETCSDAQLNIISLPDPATDTPTRYLLHSELGLHEVKKVIGPVSAPQSWLVAPTVVPSDLTAPSLPRTTSSQSEPDKKESESAEWGANGHTIPDSALYLCTPIDPLFLLLPCLLSQTHFIPIDDLYENLVEKCHPHWAAILVSGSKVEKTIRSRIKAVCTTVDAGDELTVRLDKAKLLRILGKKCARIVENGLPKSMEEEFVRKALASPVTKVQEEKPAQAGDEKEGQPAGENGDAREASNSQSNGEDRPSSETPAESDPTTALTTPISSLTLQPPSLPDAPPEIVTLLRHRLSIQLLSVYIPPTLLPELTAYVAIEHDFTSLDAYIAELARQRAELTAASAGNYSIGKSIEELEGDDQRKRKREEEEAEQKRRKKNMSVGAKKLEKVNTKGMAKMTAFFKKKE